MFRRCLIPTFSNSSSMKTSWNSPELQLYKITCLQPGVHQVAEWEQGMLNLGGSRVWGSSSAMEIKFLKFWWFTAACKSPSHTQQSHIWSLTIHFGLLASLAPVTGLCSVNLRDSTLFTIPMDENVMWQCNLLFHHLAKTNPAHKETKSSEFCIKIYALCKGALLWLTWI